MEFKLHGFKETISTYSLKFSSIWWAGIGEQRFSQLLDSVISLQSVHLFLFQTISKDSSVPLLRSCAASCSVSSSTISDL